MSLLVSRMMTTFTLIFALAVGVIGVRLSQTETTELTFDISYSKLLTTPPQKNIEVAHLEAPEMMFPVFKLPAAPVMVAKIRQNRIKPKPIRPKTIRPKTIRPKTIRVKPIVTEAIEVNVIDEVAVNANELPFQEPVTIRPVAYEGEMLSGLVALYNDLPVEEKTLVAEAPVKDEVKTAQSAQKEVTAEAEPEFFEYEKKVETKEEPIEVAAAAPEAQKEKVVENVNVLVQDVKVTPTETRSAPEPDLVAFDYSALKQDINEDKVPTVSAVTTHKKGHSAAKVVNPLVQNETRAPEVDKAPVPKFESQMTIQGVATDLQGTEPIQNFEVRFQDNQNEVFEDYGDGEVTTATKMARPKMTRSMVLLKRGFAPTNTDLILEEGSGSVSIPAIGQEQFDDLVGPYEGNGPVGALLVELDDETDKATLDVPFGMVITLDGNLKETSRDDFRYQLFVGVNAGNALLTYVHGNETTNKIVHLHERELTFESNVFEKTNMNKIALYQEDLLSHEKSALVTASENVKVFAKNITGEKLNQNTYKMNFGRALLGGRNYLELTHEAEPIFVGTKDEQNISVPSENLIKHVLSSLPGNKLGNRCLVQVNVKKKISEVFVSAESTGQSLMATVQYLDKDGRFYDSASEKTRKVIVYGENQSSEGEMNGKLNFKIVYLDGTSDFLGSYCSPNSYLVEQL